MANTISVITLRPQREFKIQSSGLVHIVFAHSRLEALRKGRDWFNTTAVRIINSKAE
mgnify:CR=1 FL=1